MTDDTADKKGEGYRPTPEPESGSRQLALTPDPPAPTPAPPAPQVYQPQIGNLPLGFPSPTLAVSVTNAEMEVIKKVTPEHISQEMTNRHQRDMKRLELQEKEIAADRETEKDDLTRDQRDREDLRRTDGRLERMFYVVLGVVVVICIAFAQAGHVDTAVKVIGTFVAVLVTLLGGVGVESLRQARKKRLRSRREKDDDDDDE